eukprot:COSAG01_NODE_1277_length_10932_cov_18.121942_14_plen_97_part_00
MEELDKLQEDLGGGQRHRRRGHGLRRGRLLNTPAATPLSLPASLPLARALPNRSLRRVISSVPCLWVRANKSIATALRACTGQVSSLPLAWRKHCS